MKLDLETIKEVYGNSCIIGIKDYLDEVASNINYLKTKGFSNTYEILERYPLLFVDTNDIFKEKIDFLINKLGNNYIEILNNNMDLWGDIE